MKLRSLSFSSRFILFSGLFLSVVEGHSNVVCPFCTAIGPTITEQFQTSKYAVVAKLVGQRKDKVVETGAPVIWSEFKILETIKDGSSLRNGQLIEMKTLTREKVGTNVLLFGQDQIATKTIRWAAPKPLDDRSAAFVDQVRDLPVNGIRRLRFFMSRLNDDNALIADDAFNEFSQATYEDLVAIRDSIDRRQLLEWINDSQTSTHRVRLYYTMLGVCAVASDADALEVFIKSGDPQKKRGLDSLVACYLLLKGRKGLEVIDHALLKNKQTTQTELFACVGALRFHGTDVDVIPKDRLLKSFRLLLDRPEIADVIITDLARWKDWTVADKLLELFMSEREEHRFMRVSIATYFLSFPATNSRDYIEKLKQKDPEAFARAETWWKWQNENDS